VPAVGEVLNDHGDLGQELAVVHGQRGNVGLRVDRVVVVAGLGFLVIAVDLFQGVVERGFAQHDVGAKRTGAGDVIQFEHGLSPWLWMRKFTPPLPASH
jgi:hypothetical protein